MKDKPTIAELEDLLDKPNLDTEILPNGEIRSFNYIERTAEQEEQLGRLEERIKDLEVKIEGVSTLCRSWKGSPHLADMIIDIIEPQDDRGH